MYGGVSGVTRLEDYATALKYWEQTKPWRGDRDTNERPLTDKRRRTTTIRKLNDGSLACKLYRTDVVTFQPNGNIKVIPWHGKTTDKTTDEFFSSVMGRRVTCWMDYRQSWALVKLKINGGDYAGKMASEVTVTFDAYGMATPKNPSEWSAFDLYKLDKSKAQRVLKEANYPAFRRWIYALDATNVSKRDIELPDAPGTLHNRLADMKRWPELLQSGTSTETTLNDLRETLYKNAGVVTVEKQRFIPWSMVDSVYAAQQRYQFWV